MPRPPLTFASPQEAAEHVRAIDFEHALRKTERTVLWLRGGGPRTVEQQMAIRDEVARFTETITRIVQEG